MKRSLAWIATAALLVAAAGAQQSTSTGETPQSQLLENGTILYLELSKTLDAKKAKAGDEIRATLLADVLSHGKIVLRQDAKLVGHITEVQAFSKDKPESRLGVAIDKVIGKGGQETAFQSLLMGISPAPRLHVDSMAGPAPPNVNPAGGPAQEKHYPTPRAASTPTPPSYRDPFSRSERDHLRSGDDPDMQATDIEGLTLQSAADGSRVVVSFKNNVKLESGVRLVLRVTTQNPANKASAQNPQ
ncbi:MAG TPA: hypothetical protein VFR84_13485 [Candidatus Angelobacter sp.]|nr:hypothetical protein [Candidatus Angelobacter sp.]